MPKSYQAVTPEQKAEYERNFKLEDDSRVTKVGKFMRRTSLDELPQLFNIFKRRHLYCRTKTRYGG